MKSEKRYDVELQQVLRSGDRSQGMRLLRERSLTLAREWRRDVLPDLTRNPRLTAHERGLIAATEGLVRMLVRRIEESPTPDGQVPPIPLPCSPN